MSVDLAALRRDLEAALHAAQTAADAVEDSPGTCNMDCVRIHVGAGQSIPRRTKAIDELFEEFGAYFSIYPKPERNFVLNYGFGQAMKRAVATEAAQKLLKERGWKCCVRYIMD